MMLPQVEVVSAPDSDASVLASLNETNGVVRLVKSVGSASSRFDLGDAPTAGTSTRTIVMTLHAINPGSRSVAVRHFSEVAAAASVPGRFLHVKMTADSPSGWFKLLGSPSGGMDFSRVYTSDEHGPDSVYSWDLTLEAEGFGYGALVTTEPITVTNLAGGFVIPDDIKGDAMTRASVLVKPGEGQSWGNHRNLLNVAPVPMHMTQGATAAEVFPAAPTPPVIIWECESLTLENDAALISGSGLAGGSGVSLDENATGWRRVLNGQVPVKPMPGTYTVWLRVSRSTGAGGMRFRFGPSGWSLPLNEGAPLFRPPAGAALSWVHLGDVSFPTGQSAANLSESDMSTPAIALHARGMNSGSSGHRIVVDRIALVPVRIGDAPEARTMMATWKTAGPIGPGPLWNSWLCDGYNERNSLALYDNSLYGSAEPPTPRGQWIELHPGFRHVGIIMHKTNDTVAGVESITGSCEVTFSYYPRYRHMAGT